MTTSEGQADAEALAVPASTTCQTSPSAVRHLYAVSLGRAAESEDSVAIMSGMPLQTLLQTFFLSPEFHSNIIQPLQSGRRLHGGLLDQSPGQDLVEWCADSLPVTLTSAAAIRASAASWYKLYLALFTDAEFVNAVFAPDADLSLTVDNLRAFSRIEGLIERARADEVRGWAVSPTAPSDPVTVEAWVSGERVGVAIANGFRRDVQDRFGGEGCAGFVFDFGRIRTELRGSRVEIREALSGVLVDVAELSSEAAPLSAHAAIMRELAQLRAGLARVESSLPSLRHDFTYDLEDYGEYHEAYSRIGSGARHAHLQQCRTVGAVVAVLIETRDQPDNWIEDLVESVLEQTVDEWCIFLLGDDHAQRDLANRVAWKTGRSGAVIMIDPSSGDGFSSLPLGRFQLIVQMDGSEILAPQAFERLLAAIVTEPDAAQVDAVFWDEDHLAETAAVPWNRRRHRMPVLKPGFDIDLLRQEPYVGSVAAWSPRAWSLIGAGAPNVSESMLRLFEANCRILHLANILSSRQRSSAPDPNGWSEVVRAHLGRVGEAAEVSVVDDILGAGPRIRIDRSAGLGSLSAAVIIPTRDRMDLLKPCVDSLIANRSANRIAMQILIVNHRSSEPETLAYLDALEKAGEIEVMAYDGEYNWSLMNNLAAAQTGSDILVFLNNDTVVIEPSWLDALCANAARPEVGAVGARLIYADGTLQHAGFVARDLPGSLAVPEGIGVAGRDGGYMKRHARVRSAAAVTGACIALRAKVFRRVGGFDVAHLPIDWNDVDLCMKVQAEELKVLYDPDATLFHFESKTRGFTRDGEKLAASSQASTLVWNRWHAAFATDPGYNAHFDRAALPFSRLAPPA